MKICKNTQKDVDYIGAVVEFEFELEDHAAVMHTISGHNLSIHTGSDKFSIYPIIASHAQNLNHVKTVGTSYLECLREIAAKDQDFFREILDLVRAKYDTNRATYHLFGKVENVPPSKDLTDDQLLKLFDQFDARQVLHVTFGSVLDDSRTRFMEVLDRHQNLYEEYLQIHFMKHLAPFEVVGN